MVENKWFFIGQRIIKIKNFYWVVSTTTNAVWKCDHDFNVVDYFLFDEEMAISDLFRAVVCVNEEIFFFPFNANNAYKYEVNTQTLQKINVEIPAIKNINSKFSYAFVVQNWIIVVGRNVGGFLKYNLYTGETTFVAYNWSPKDAYICSFSHAIKGENTYTVSVLDAFALEYNFINNTIARHDFSAYCDKSLSAILSDEEYLYIVTDRCELVKLDDKLGVLEIRKLGMHDKSIRAAECGKNGCWYIGNTLGSILTKEDGKSTVIPLDFEPDKELGYCFTAVELYEDKLLLQSRNNGELIFFDFKNKVKDKLSISVDKVLIEKYICDLDSLVKRGLNKGWVLIENNYLNIDKYLSLIGDTP